MISFIETLAGVLGLGAGILFSWAYHHKRIMGWKARVKYLEELHIDNLNRWREQ